MKYPLTSDIQNQLLVNKYSGFNTVFINDKEYQVIEIKNNVIEVL